MWKKPRMNMMSGAYHCLHVKICVDLRVFSKSAVRVSREGFCCAVGTYSLLFSIGKLEKHHQVQKRKNTRSRGQRKSWASGSSVDLLIGHIPLHRLPCLLLVLFLSLGEVHCPATSGSVQLKGKNGSLPSYDLRSLLSPSELFQAQYEPVHTRKDA